MKILSLTLLIAFFYIGLYSQENVEYKFYKNIKKKHAVEERKAKYVEEIKYINDSVKVVEYCRIKDHVVVNKSECRKDRILGTWHVWRSHTFDLNYNHLIYGRYKPSGFYAFNVDENQLEIESSDSFIAPKLFNTDKDIVGQCDWGEESGFSNFKAVNIKYPREAQESGMQGTVVIQFCIDKTGKVGFVNIIEGVCKSLDNEAYRVITSLPQFIPAKLNGKNIDIFIEISIDFTLV